MRVATVHLLTGTWPDYTLMRRGRLVGGRTTLAAALTLSLLSSCTTDPPTPAATAKGASRSATSSATSSAARPATGPSRPGHPGKPRATPDPKPSSFPADPLLPASVRTPTGNSVTIAFGGDVHFEGASRAALSGFGPIADVLGAYDLAMVNLETAVTDGGTAEAKQFNFRAPPTAFAALRSAGVDVATMANNHGMDYGVQGLRDSLSAAAAAAFPVVGIGVDDAAAFAPYRRTINGQRIAIIGATQVLDGAFVASWASGPDKPGLASAKQENKLLAAVRAARASADSVVVYLHWGQERVSCPIAAQRSLSAKLTAAGADVVVGSHAHVLLGGGWTKEGAYVDYGLGNFVFYAHGGVGAQTGVLALTLRGHAVTNATWKPAVISGGRPLPTTGAAAAAAVTSWDRLRACTDLAGHG